MGQRFKRSPSKDYLPVWHREAMENPASLSRTRLSPGRKSGHSLNGLHFVQIRSIAYEHVEVQDGLAIVVSFISAGTRPSFRHSCELSSFITSGVHTRPDATHRPLPWPSAVRRLFRH